MNEAWGYDGLLGNILGGAFGGIATDPGMAQQTSEIQLANMRAAMNLGARNAWMPPEPSREEEARKVRVAALEWCEADSDRRIHFLLWMAVLLCVAFMWWRL